MLPLGPLLVLCLLLGSLDEQFAAATSPDRGSARVSTTSQPVARNRLRAATSPYLQQHADNPVEWCEWGPAALERACAADKPIFLSIGYAACHWCHVMAHESFADEATAAVLNRLFINIKVDREERPDLDEIYMRATVVLNQGQGGWPMSVWLTPDLKPFFAGTYFPPAARYGRPGFRELCERIGQAWAEHRAEITAHADQLTAAVRDSLQTRAGATADLSRATVDETTEALAGVFDGVSGGLAAGGTNKFPPSMALELLLRSAARRPADSARCMQFVQHVERTLDHMAAGGIYDQLGGGIHRYSTDVEWHVPHFEKMLYDQALVSRIYLDAYQFTRRESYAAVARDMFDYVLRDLRAPGGGFYSSRDADSEGQEGRYYVWTRAQVQAVLDQEEAELFCAHYDISESGNWDDPHDPGARKSIPRVLRDYCCCGKLYGLTVGECAVRLARARQKLLAVRAQRVPPARDEKILCEWNGLMIASLARGGSVLDDRQYVDAAAQAADFILRHQYADGRLHRAWCAGHLTDVAFLSDYACLIEGLIELYEATFDRRWSDSARALTRTAVERFWDQANGGFFFTPDDHETLIARSKEVADNAVPSGNSVMLMNLLRLATLLGDQELRRRAERQMAVFADEVTRSPYSAERFLAAVDFACGKPLEIVIVGDPAQPTTQALLRQVHATYLPNRVLALHNPVAPERSIDSPLLSNRTLVDGRPTAYVCRNYTCRRSTTTPETLAAELADR